MIPEFPRDLLEGTRAGCISQKTRHMSAILVRQAAATFHISSLMIPKIGFFLFRMHFAFFFSVCFVMSRCF